jgi:uncharacterized protein YprB with RNaseH-like and TPR domain
VGWQKGKETSKTIPEREWKYLRKIQPEMLSALCAGINRQAMDLLQSHALSEHEKCQRLYKHVRDSDRINAAEVIWDFFQKHPGLVKYDAIP